MSLPLRLNLLNNQNIFQKSKNQNSLIVLWNEIEGSTKSLTAKQLHFIDVLNYKSESEREEKVKNCIYTYYQTNTTSLLDYIKSKYPCFEKEEISEILKKCIFVKVLKNEIPDLIASYIYTKAEKCTSLLAPEDYCFNWCTLGSTSTPTPVQAFYKLVHDLKDQLSRSDNVRFFRCSIFFNSEGFDEVHYSTAHKQLRSFNWYKEFPFQLSKVNETTSVLHIYWRHYEFVLRRIEEFRCLRGSTTSLLNDFMKFLLCHEERYFENTYVINLTRRPDKKVFWDLGGGASKLPFLQPTIFEAVDAIEVMEDVLAYENYKEQIDKMLLENRRLSKFFIDKLTVHNAGFILNPQRYTMTCLNQGAYGVLMSNIKIMTKSLKDDNLYTCILEDDARFHKSFKEEWYRISLSLPSDWNVLALGTKNYHTPITTSSKFHFFNEFTTGAHAMIYRKDALEILVPFLTEHPFVAFDELLKIAMFTMSEQLHGYVIDPSLVITLCGEDSLSDIQSHSKHCTETYDFFQWDVSKYDLDPVLC